MTAKQAMATVVVVLALGIVGNAIEVWLDWHAMRDQVRARMATLLETVEGSAVEAAYQLSPELAVKVVDGLLGYDVVEFAGLSDNFGDPLARRQRSAIASPATGIAEVLFGDIATYRQDLKRGGTGAAKEVGRLEVRLSPAAVAGDFYRRALVNAGLGLARSLAIVALVVGIFYVMITRPLLRLAKGVALVDPNHPGARPLEQFPSHRGDELGQLVASLNALLHSSQKALTQRDTAQADLTKLTHDLERRVAERTSELEAANGEIRSLNALLKAENVRLGAELDVSRRIQQMVLPTRGELAEIASLDLATYMEPATEVGGDYYDILRGEDGRVRIGIGDVTGHGLESGVVMLMTQSVVRTMVTSDESDAVRALDIVNRTLYQNVQRLGGDKNLTLALLDYRPAPPEGAAEAGTVAHLRVSGQHESIVVVRNGGRVELVDTLDLGFPLGLIEEVGPFINEMTIPLAPGDSVLLYTDGITEAANERQELYGLERLCDVAARHWQDDAQTIKDAVIADVKRHIGDQVLYDDITLVVLRQTGPAEPQRAYLA